MDGEAGTSCVDGDQSHWEVHMPHVGWGQVIRALAVAMAIVLVPQGAKAQTGKISGLVTDATSGQPVEAAQIVLQGTGYGTATNANGRYFIISVPPGTYTLVARRVGFQPKEISGVTVRIDATREINISLNSAAQTLQAERIVADPTPLVERGVTGSAQAISAEVINVLPVTSITEVLQLQQGFLQVPQNTDIVSFTESRRNVQTPLRIRGGRGGETLTLIDGIPINNVVFGGPALDLTASAVQQIDFQKGGFEPQYGNALSGIVNIATREGGSTLAGNVEYQSSALAGAFGSPSDELRKYDLLRGFLSGPIPGTGNRVRFMVSGQQGNGADGVYRFDQDVFDAERIRSVAPRPEELDLFAGWRALGFDRTNMILGKLTVLPTGEATTKLNLSILDYTRGRQPADFDYLLTGFDPFTAPAVNSREDTLALAPFRGYRDVVLGSIRADRRLYSASLEQRFGRANLVLRGARFEQGRTTCNYFQGICLGARFADINFNDRFVAPGIQTGVPYTGTDAFFGGEKVKSDIMRADMQSQVTDHHNLQGGVFFQRHDISFLEDRNVGTNVPLIVPQRYFAKPTEAAAYLQDRIEYDFLTIKLGFRFDYGMAGGYFFRNPLDPSNATTAREVCSGSAPSLGATTPFTYTNPETGVTYQGVAACLNSPPISEQNQRQVLLDSATRLAQADDFEKAKARAAFSPRVGVSFPISERSTLFFNAGRYSQNPLYNLIYQGTGVGVRAGQAGGNVCPADQARPRSNECSPILFSEVSSIPFLGNPNLLLEQSTQYEVGYASEIGRTYAVNLTVFSKDNTGLSGTRPSRPVQDIGTTYYGQSLPQYAVIVNQDYATTRGVEIQFRRRLTNFWGYDINYSFSKATTNAAPPDRQTEAESQGDLAQRREIRSEIDQPHVFNASLFFNVGSEAPRVRLGPLLRNTGLSFTFQAASGLPYTPTNSFSGFGETNFAEPNSGRAPGTFLVNAMLTKGVRVSNLSYDLFVRVTNLFDAKNCIQVFTTTGRCDVGTVDQRRARQGNAVGELTSTTFFNRPEFFGARRAINTGVKVSF